jgi:DNA-binding NarL/FixJ family response regulator
MKLAIADDSALLRERIKDLVKMFSAVKIVGEAENGVEALQLIIDKEPDLVILDIRMPEMNGIEVLKKIKERGSKTKICILTNYPNQQYKKRCLAEGADYFFDKNKDFQRIATVIAELVQTHKG